MICHHKVVACLYNQDAVSDLGYEDEIDFHPERLGESDSNGIYGHWSVSFLSVSKRAMVLVLGIVFIDDVLSSGQSTSPTGIDFSGTANWVNLGYVLVSDINFVYRVGVNLRYYIQQGKKERLVVGAFKGFTGIVEAATIVLIGANYGLKNLKIDLFARVAGSANSAAFIVFLVLDSFKNARKILALNSKVLQEVTRPDRLDIRNRRVREVALLVSNIFGAVGAGMVILSLAGVSPTLVGYLGYAVFGLIAASVPSVYDYKGKIAAALDRGLGWIGQMVNWCCGRQTLPQEVLDASLPEEL